MHCNLRINTVTLNMDFTRISKNTNLYMSSGLCRGCVLGTFSTLKSGMSPIILAVGANVPTYLRFMNGNRTEETPEKLQMSPYLSMIWVICPHFSKALAKYCVVIIPIYIQKCLWKHAASRPSDILHVNLLKENIWIFIHILLLITLSDRSIDEWV